MCPEVSSAPYGGGPGGPGLRHPARAWPRARGSNSSQRFATAIRAPVRCAAPAPRGAERCAL